MRFHNRIKLSSELAHSGQNSIRSRGQFQENDKL